MIFCGDLIHDSNPVAVGFFIRLGRGDPVIADHHFFLYGVLNPDHGIIACCADFCIDCGILLGQAGLDGVVVGVAEKTAQIRSRHSG